MLYGAVVWTKSKIVSKMEHCNLFELDFGLFDSNFWSTSDWSLQWSSQIYVKLTLLATTLYPYFPDQNSDHIFKPAFDVTLSQNHFTVGISFKKVWKLTLEN